MLHIFSQILPIICPILIITTLGFLWNKLGNNLNENEIIKLITWIGAPTLVFNTLITSEANPLLIQNIMFIALLLTLFMLIFSYFILKVFKEPIRALINPMTFQNSGNLGLTLCFFAFGKIGLELAIIYFMITSILHFTLGLTIWSGNISIKHLLKTPIIYAVILGLVINIYNIHIPITITNTTSVLAGITIPLLIFTMGTSLSKIQFRIETKIIFLILIRTLVFLAIAYLLTILFKIDGIAQKIILIQSVLPAPIFTYLFASQYKIAPDKVANYLMTSTLISIMTITIFLTLILK